MAKVLVIDDEKGVREMVRRMLESEHHTILEAADGIDGVKVFQEEQPDVVVTDIIMPNADGLEVIQRILKINPQAKIVAMSGGGRLADETYLKYARKFGAATVLSKPFPPDELLSLIRDLSNQEAPHGAHGAMS